MKKWLLLFIIGMSLFVWLSTVQALNLVYVNLTRNLFLYQKNIDENNDGVAINSTGSVEPCISPNWNTVVYRNTTDSRLYKKNLSDTSNGAAITDSASYNCVFSIDWQFLYYVLGADLRIYKKSINDTSYWVSVTSFPVVATTIKLSKDGQYIYYISTWYKLYKKSANDSSFWTQITTSNVLTFDISPDGQYIVYWNDSDWGRLYKKSANDNSNWVAIWTAMYASSPLYSLDGLNIYYRNNSDGSKLYKKSANDNSNWIAVSNDSVIQSAFIAPTCYDGIKNQDETSIDFWGVCWTVPRNGLMAEYLFGGNSNDTSGNNYAGSTANVTYADDAQIWKTANFNGSNSKIDLPVFPAPTDFSFSTWIKINSLNWSSNWGDHRIFVLGDTVKEFTVWAGDNARSDQFKRRFTFSLWNGSNWTAVKASADWNINTWYQVTAVRSGWTASLYVNWVLVWTTTSFYQDAISWSKNAIWYKRQSNDNFANIQLNRSRIYNRALSSSEVQTLFNEPNSTTSPTTSTPAPAFTCPANMCCSTDAVTTQPTGGQGMMDTAALALSNLGDPITLSTGESVYSDTFLKTQAPGVPFEFTLTNKTRATYDGPVGFGWDHNNNIFLREEADGSVMYYDGMLGVSPFPKNTDGTFARNNSAKAQPTKTGGLYDITFDSGNVYHFANNLRLATITDKNQNITTFTYDANNRLTKVTDSLGRDAVYAYFDNGRIKTVTDSNGRVATMAYYGASDPLGNENDLKSLTISNPDTSTKTVSYQYTKVDDNQILSHNISKLVDAKGQTYVENTYDTNDRVTAQKFGDGTLTYTYVLDATNKYVTKTTVTNKRGTVTEYTYDQYGNNLTMTVLAAVWTGSLAYTYAYDVSGRMISEKKPRGNGTAYVYDIRGNILEKRQKMDMTAANNDAVDLVTKYVYDTNYRNVIERTLPSGLKTAYTYDTKGNLTESKIVAATLNSGTTTDITISNEYDTKGRLTKSTDPEGNISTYEYGTGSVITKITKGLRNSEAGLDATAARVVTYTYDARGNPFTTTDPEGNVSTFTYDAFDRLTSQLSAAGIRKNFVFSANNKNEKTIIPLTESVSLTEENTYDTLDEIIGTKLSSTPSDARNLLIVRDKNENIVSTTDPSGLTTKYTYDALERVTEKRLVTVANDPTKDIVTRYEYDTNGNQIKITDPIGAITVLTYDLFDRPKTKTDALGTKTTYTYDTVGNITETRTESATGALLAKSSVVFNSITRPLTQSVWNLSTNTPVIQSYTYDKNGNILTLTDPRGGVTTTSYSLHWQPVEITDPVGNKTQFTYDKRGLVITRKSLTTDGKIATTSYLYDGDGRVLSSTDALGNIQKYTYDAFGRVTKKTDPANNITDYIYDAFGNLLSENVRFGTGTVTTSYEYDTANRVTKLTDAKGNVTTYTYDILGRKTKQTSADGSFITFVYDAASRLTESTDANGTVVTNIYDPLGRLTARTILTGTGVLWTTSESYSYDPLGRLVSANDSQSGSLAFIYDSLGRLTTESQGMGQIGYTYDLAGNRTKITTGTGYLVDLAYDPLSRLSAVSYNGANIATYGYTGASLSSLQFANGVTTSTSQDLIGRLTALDFGTTGVPGRVFTYSANGNILSDGQKDYTYDVLSRLTQTQSQSGALTVPENTLYAYDAVGNRLAENKLQTTQSYTTNVLNQYLALNDSTASGATTFTYDLNGNILSNAKLKFAYDYQNRLVEVRNAADNSLVARYTYDVLGRRTSKSVGDATTTYLYVGTDVIKESKKATPESTALDTLRVYGNGADDLLAYTTQESSVAPSVSEEYAFCLKSVTPSKASFLKYGWTALIDRCNDLATQTQNATIATHTYYLLKDHQNSTLALTDASGSLVASYSYDGFGLPYISTGSGAFAPLSAYTGSLHNNDRFFTGREYDAETGLYYYRARTYDPILGRFLQRDPVGTADQINLYTYVGNNPVRFVDPSGMVIKTTLVDTSNKIVAVAAVGVTITWFKIAWIADDWFYQGGQFLWSSIIWVTNQAYYEGSGYVKSLKQTKDYEALRASIIERVQRGEMNFSSSAGSSDRFTLFTLGKYDYTVSSTKSEWNLNIRIRIQDVYDFNKEKNDGTVMNNYLNIMHDANVYGFLTPINTEINTYETIKWK